MSYALLFPGQASQHPAMLPWLESEPAAAPALQAMADRLGTAWRSLLHDADYRSSNAFAQVLVTGTSLAAWEVLRDRLPGGPAVVAGYSIGELAAFACAGVFTTAQALGLAARRAALMDQSVAGLETGLLSVSGLPESLVLARCAGLGLECAIRVGPSQGVYAGAGGALLQAGGVLAALGATCRRLEVRLASHSSWMAPAARTFSALLTDRPFAAPACPVAVNALGTLCQQPAELRLALGRQLDHTVQWSSCMDAIAERQVSCVLEVGAGSALSRMWNDRYPHIPARALDDFRQARGALEWVERQAYS